MKKAAATKEVSISLWDSNLLATHITSFQPLLMEAFLKGHACESQWWKCVGNAALLQIPLTTA